MSHKTQHTQRRVLGVNSLNKHPYAPHRTTAAAAVAADISFLKVSLSVNPDIRLFDDGTDPDDVRRGAFADSWLLSALSMISAVTIGDGGVDEQVQFVCLREVVWAGAEGVGGG